MSKNDFINKIKEGVSVQEVEDFARKYSTETFTILAIVIATISSVFDFFTGPKLTIFFLAVGAVLGVFFPVQVERGLKRLYSFAFKQEQTTQIMVGVVKLIVAIFIPFLYFGLLGLLAGTSYHYYTRHAQIAKENKPSKPQRGGSGDEHD